MSEFDYRTHCFYDKEGMLGCLVYYSDGKYIDTAKKIYTGVTHNFIKKLMDLHTSEKYISLYYRLNDYDKHDFVTEKDLEFIIMDGLYDVFAFGGSQRYDYPYVRDGASIFRTVCRNEKLYDFKYLKEDGTYDR